MLEHTARQDKQIPNTQQYIQSHTIQRKTFEGENFHELAENTIFAKKTFVDCSLVLPMDTVPKISRRNFLKYPQNLKYGESFLLYDTFKSYIEAMIPDEFTQEPYMTSRSYNYIHVQYIKSTSKGLYNQRSPLVLFCIMAVQVTCYVITTTELLHEII